MLINLCLFLVAISLPSFKHKRRLQKMLYNGQQRSQNYEVWGPLCASLAVCCRTELTVLQSKSKWLFFFSYPPTTLPSTALRGIAAHLTFSSLLQFHVRFSFTPMGRSVNAPYLCHQAKAGYCQLPIISDSDCKLVHETVGIQGMQLLLHDTFWYLSFVRIVSYLLLASGVKQDFCREKFRIRTQLQHSDHPD